jgi:Ca2+-binding RTX toxin-like protein
MIIKPPIPVAMSDNSMVLVLSFLPNTTYDLPNTNAIDLSKLGDESKYTIDYLGDKNDNILTGTTKDEIFVAGAGNDILTTKTSSIYFIATIA